MAEGEGAAVAGAAAQPADRIEAERLRIAADNTPGRSGEPVAAAGDGGIGERRRLVVAWLAEHNTRRGERVAIYASTTVATVIQGAGDDGQPMHAAND